LVRQVYVQYDGVGRQRLGHGNRFFAIRCFSNHVNVSLGTQDISQPLAK
jgi:hypothetical protein